MDEFLDIDGRELVLGETYVFTTSDGTEYEDAVLLEVSEDGGLMISPESPLNLVVGIAPHEFATAEHSDSADDKVVRKYGNEDN